MVCCNCERYEGILDTSVLSHIAGSLCNRSWCVRLFWLWCRIAVSSFAESLAMHFVLCVYLVMYHAVLFPSFTKPLAIKSTWIINYLSIQDAVCYIRQRLSFCLLKTLIVSVWWYRGREVPLFNVDIFDICNLLPQCVSNLPVIGIILNLCKNVLHPSVLAGFVQIAKLLLSHLMYSSIYSRVAHGDNSFYVYLTILN